MIIRKATIDDTELLVKLRVDFLLDEGKIYAPKDIEALGLKLYDYFTRHIPDSTFVAFIAEDAGKAVATTFLSVVERPPRTATASNLVGTVYNVYTYPDYRKRGIATELMKATMEAAKQLGVSYVDLLATDAGRPLYEKLGFEKITKYTAMRIDI